MLITTGSAEQTLTALRHAGIAAAQIGVMRAEGRVVRRGERTEALVPPPRDELWRVLEEHAPAG